MCYICKERENRCLYDLLDLSVQEDVVDEGSVAVVDTEARIAELDALGHALRKQ